MNKEALAAFASLQKEFESFVIKQNKVNKSDDERISFLEVIQNEFNNHRPNSSKTE